MITFIIVGVVMGALIGLAVSIVIKIANRRQPFRYSPIIIGAGVVALYMVYRFYIH